VHEVELALRRVIGHDVVPADHEVRVGEVLEEGRLQVGGEDLPAIAHAFTEPRRDRGAAGADFPARQPAPTPSCSR
jgi:hypothetical protein